MLQHTGNHAQSASSDPQTFPLDGPGPEQISLPLPNGRPPVVASVHTRDASVTRGRPQQSSTQNYGATYVPSSRAGSAQPQPQGTDSGGSSRGPSVDTTGLQRRTSNNYGHHRQTSVIHGLQHSRNPSFNTPSGATPLTPESSLSGPGHARSQHQTRRGQYAAAEGSSNFTSPGSPLQGHSQGQSIDSLLDGPVPVHESGQPQPRRRKEHSRTRRGHAYQSSSVHQNEPRTPGEYALHHLFHAFVLRADQRINHCLSLLETVNTPVELACGPGVDPGFDQLISSLGHISRQGPKPLVDSLMLWRKGKGDAAANLKKQVYQQRLQQGLTTNTLPISLPRRHTEPLQVPGEPGLSTVGTDSPLSSEDTLTQEYILADRRATISVYILCRVLIAIFEQSNLAAITQDLANKLEDIVFTQIREVEPNQILSSSIRLANWRIYGQVLGHMSRLDFLNVTLRFTQQLDTWQQEFAKTPGTAAARDIESRLELLLLSMRHLHIAARREAVQPVVDFLRTLAGLFSDAHGPRVKQAYCQLFERLLTAVASSPECFQTNSKWRDLIDAINARLSNMMVKVRHWYTGFPVSILLLCISPLETFSTQWGSLLSGMPMKLKDKASRGLALQAICQLTWTYFMRVPEPAATRVRRIEEVLKLALPQGKKTHVSSEQSVSTPLVHLMRIIGFAAQDICFKSIIFPLVHYDKFQSSRSLKIEDMEPERMVVGIRAFLAVIADLERDDDRPPPFPSFNIQPPTGEGLPGSPLSMRNNVGLDSPTRTTFEEETLSSLPVDTSKLDDNARQYYLQFCQILGKITILCDNTFGGQAALNEKFSTPTTTLTPKTPLVDAFTIKREQEGPGPDQRHMYYELLHVAIQALPRCFTDHIPLSPLINLLCTGSAHVQANIAASATQSLKAIARQGHAQAVAIAFPRFIFHYDTQYSTMSDEGRLGPAHIESTLTLYLDLLQIWTEQLKQKTVAKTAEARGANSSRALQMELTNVIPHVDEIEAYGLFFLCSQSRRVRAFAIKVLRLVLQFDKVLGQDVPSRIIRLLELQSSKILDLQEEGLNVAERSRLQKDKSASPDSSTLIEICSSEVSYDSTLWLKAFPNLIRAVFDACPNAIALCRGTVTDRLVLMQRDIESFSDTGAGNPAAYEYRMQGRSSATSAEVLFEQWKLYLIMACVTLSSPGAQSQSQLADAAHARKTSKGATATQDKLSSARALFSAIIPMLGASPEAIRDAVVSALGSINRKLCRTLLESLQYAVIKCNDEAKARINHQRTPSSPQRSQQTERLRTEVTHVYKLTAAFLRYEDIYTDEWILQNLVNYNRDLRIFLSDTDVQNDWRFQKLRYHYCGLIEEIFEGVNRSKTPTRWMPFEARKSAFALMEDWCGYSAEQNLFDPNHNHGRDYQDRLNANAAAEKERNNLKVAALSAMATLCAGPISIVTDSHALLSFNVQRMLSWVDGIFSTNNHKMHTIGRRALRLLLVNNPEHLVLAEHAIEQCYRTESSSMALESYFGVVSDLLIQQTDYPLPFWKILSIIVLTLGNENREIRMKSAHLIRTLDDRQQKSSNLQDFDISISDKTRAVYKLAQFEYSKRLSKANSDIAFLIFSEFSLHYKSARNDHQRNMVVAILPWVQTLELQVDPGTGGPTAISYMLLANMFEITICSSNAMHNEVQALWQALATGPHAGNVQLILDFVIYLSLDRRDQNFVEYAKQIVVYLSSTLAGSRVLEFFLLQLTPKNMVNDRSHAEVVLPDTRDMPYVADLGSLLPMGSKQVGLSLGQVSLIFLVDLVVSPVVLPKDEAIKLIHTVLILWDHYTSSVQEQAREMLVHLIHELVTTKIDSQILISAKSQIEGLVEAVRTNDVRVSWSYEKNTRKDEDDGGSRVPPAMSTLTAEIVGIFDLAFENFSEAWAKEALHWASICPVRHLACRSFQVYRCISVSLDARMLADMLARLSNTIADEQTDYQTFSMEILTTLKVVIGALESKNLLRYPQLFWTTCACLNTIHEREFYETLGMLEKFIEKLDLSAPEVTEAMLKGQPAKWEGRFEGVQSLLYKGLKSADSLDKTLSILHKLAELPECDLVGHEDRLLYCVLANLPRFLQTFELETVDAVSFMAAGRLAQVADDEGHELLSTCLQRFADKEMSTSREMLSAAIQALKASYFPTHDARSLIFMIGLLTNKTPWFRVKLMDVLCELIPLVNMKNVAITSHGPDLISPLLRLLQTEHCTQALEVMDYIMEVAATPMEKHHMRMSMTTGSAKAIRKEYERTQSLYGIPLPSGWSIPMPAIYSSMTRKNVHAVFYTCGDSESLKEQETSTPDVKFQGDDGYTDSYFPPQSRADTIRSMEVAADTNVSDLMNTLDSLDDFFDDVDGDGLLIPTAASHLGVDNLTLPPLTEQSTTVYDEQTAPILRQSLGRSSSQVDVQDGFTETGPLPAMTQRGQLSMYAGQNGAAQTSFSSIDELGGPGPSLPTSTRKPVLQTVTSPQSRPGLHARSITSPANQFPMSQPTSNAFYPMPSGLGRSQDDYADQYDDAVLSDGENSPFPSLNMTATSSSRILSGPGPEYQATPTSATEGGGSFSLQSMRRGMRRLTGGKSESQKEKEKARDVTRLRGQSGGQNLIPATILSPRVPKVPLEYLNASNLSGMSPTTPPGI
ncbi:cell morphogenesis N-terminal-domain-containing protein [Exophiala viscosa]|uniref:cell morphogenesis N-terminal-domain-containing protein n=1 Tax=Exophiala viscosa TaxID=2486360 RepID=UPI00219DECA0|nr:cell morphogenesis N-terminal-domain-containing protein [Exophiala viscosa]